MTAARFRDGVEIERAIVTFASKPDGGLIVTSHPIFAANRDLIIALAARHRLPAIYAVRYFATEGGLMSYGPDQIDQWRGAARYVDRLLRGEKPADLAVQAPTKYELLIDLKTAKSLGLTVPDTLLATADEVIEQTLGLRCTCSGLQLAHRRSQRMSALAPLLECERTSAAVLSL